MSTPSSTAEAAGSPEERIAELYRRAGFEVRRAVGESQGSLVWLATPTRGSQRSTTLFRALPAAPDEPRRWLTELEATRRAIGAEQALGVVLEGPVPSIDAREVTPSHAHARLITFRRWLLEVSGIAAYVRELIRRYERSDLATFYVPRRARLGQSEVDAELVLEDWIERGNDRSMIIAGPITSGKTRFLLHAAQSAGLRFESDPDRATPLVFHGYDVHPIDGLDLPETPQRDLLLAAAERGFALPVMLEERSLDTPRSILEIDLPQTDARGDLQAPELRLMDPAPDEVRRAIEEYLGASEHCMAFSRACRANASFAALAGDLRNASVLARAVRRHARPEPLLGIHRWVVDVVGDYIDDILDDDYYYPNPKAVVAEAAYRYHQWGETDGLIEAAAMLTRASRLWGIGDGHLRHAVVLEYLVGVHVARQVTSEDLSVLLEGPFPRFALHTMAAIAPDVAADLTVDHVARLEEQMEQQVEKRIRLTFAHMLNRPVGMLRQHLRDIREGIDEGKASALSSLFRGAEDELAYLADLAEKTRLWQEVPEGPFEDLPLSTIVEEVIRPLTERHPKVPCVVSVDPTVMVHVIDHVLRDVLHCVIENAFHAALMGSHGPSVHVATRTLGDTVVIEVEDSGDGVAAEETERIFEPFRTTKKGGSGKPRGTGLGLVIARKYARVLGGRVGLLTEREQTTFSIELIGKRRSE